MLSTFTYGPAKAAPANRNGDAATDSLGVYGELSGITKEVSGDDTVNWGAKLGAKFVF